MVFRQATYGIWKYVLAVAFFMFHADAKAQNVKDQVFWDEFDQARLYIARHNAARSIKILEGLYEKDSLDPNVNYLLGVALIIVGKEADRAAQLFEVANGSYAELWDNPGVGPPEHLSYYQILAYCRTGQCNKAQESLTRLESIFNTDQEFLKHDEYYLIDGRKWANRCKEPVSAPMEIPERLVRSDLKVQTEPHRYTTQAILYGVQVAALLEPRMTRSLDGLKNVDVYVDMNGVYRYVIGNFVFRSQAQKMLEVVRSEGYADAFIVQVNDQERYPLEVVALDETSPKAEISGEVQYMVQIAAFNDQLPDESARYYLMVDSIAEIRLDDLTLLTVGNYKSYGNAIERRDELRRMGFKDAFVVAFNRGRKVPLNDARRYLRKFHE